VNNINRAYQLKNIEKYKKALAVKSSQNKSASSISTSAIITLSNLSTAVKQYNENFNPSC
jgi:hypothetical protein